MRKSTKELLLSSRVYVLSDEEVQQGNTALMKGVNWIMRKFAEGILL